MRRTTSAKAARRLGVRALVRERLEIREQHADVGGQADRAGEHARARRDVGLERLASDGAPR